MPPRQRRIDPNALIQASMNRKGSGGTSQNLMAAMQQFMQTFAKSMGKMMEQVGQASAQQADQSGQQQARIADAAERVFNQAQQKAEIRRQENRQDVLTQESREFQMSQSDYNMTMQKQIQEDAQSVAMLIQAEESAKSRMLEKRERDSSYIADAAQSANKWIDSTDANNGWDAIPNGMDVRNQMLDLIRMSEVVNEDFYDSPYADRLHAMVSQTQQAILRGDESFETIVGSEPERPMLSIPASMMDTIGIDLPILSRAEMKEWRNRNGYPKGGVWALKTDDPKRLLVNPVGFSAMMAAKQHDTTLSMLGTKKAQQRFLIDQAKAQREWDRYSKPLEEMEVELGKQYNRILPESMSSVLKPAAMRASLGGVEAAAGTDPMSMMMNFYASAVKNPDQMEKLGRLSLEEGNEKRWVPGAPATGQKADKGQQVQDFYDVSRMGAAGDAMEAFLDNASTNPNFQNNVAAWIGGLPEADMWKIGLNEDVASAVAQIKRRGARHERSLDSADTKMLMRRAVSQVISTWRSTNRERFVVPLRNNNVRQVWRDANHAAGVLQDSTAVAIMSRMEPEELQELGATGHIPEGLIDEAGRQKMFRTPQGILQSVVTLNTRPGARRALGVYTNGSLTPDQEEVEKADPVAAYYTNTAANGVPGFVPVPTPRDPKMAYTQPHRALVERLHQSRAASVTTVNTPDPADSDGTPVAPTPAQPAQPGPAQAPVGPSAPPQLSEPQAPLSNAPQLGPQPQLEAPALNPHMTLSQQKPETQ